MRFWIAAGVALVLFALDFVLWAATGSFDCRDCTLEQDVVGVLLIPLGVAFVVLTAVAFVWTLVRITSRGPE